MRACVLTGSLSSLPWTPTEAQAFPGRASRHGGLWATAASVTPEDGQMLWEAEQQACWKFGWKPPLSQHFVIWPWAGDWGRRPLLVGTQAQRGCEPSAWASGQGSEKKAGASAKARALGASSWMGPCGPGQMWAERVTESLATPCLQGRERRDKRTRQSG